MNIRGMYLALSDADAVLAGDRAAVLDAQVEDRAGHLLGRSASPGTASSKSTSGCRLPSPAWKTFATRTPRLVGEPPMRAQHLRQRGPRDHAVLDDVVGADPADRGEGRLAALPEQRPLGVVGGDPDLERAVRRRQCRSTCSNWSRPRPRPVQLDDQHRAGALGVAAVHRRLGRLDRQRVHHLDRGRDDARRR